MTGALIVCSHLAVVDGEPAICSNGQKSVAEVEI
jgi:hypothetical protein